MGIIKENENVQVEFSGEVVPLALGLPQPEGHVVPAIAIMPLHEAMEIKDAANQRKFNDYDVRFVFFDTHNIDFFIQQLQFARKILEDQMPTEDGEQEEVQENSMEAGE